MAFIDQPHAELVPRSDNELAYQQKDDGQGRVSWDDPLKISFGAFQQPDGKYYIGAIGMDVLTRHNGQIRRGEVGFFKFAIDEMVDGDGDPVPMVELFLCPRVGQTEDADNQRVLTISRKGAIFHVPILGAQPSARVTRFETDRGRFVFNFQDDTGKPSGIVYDTHHPAWNSPDPSAAAVGRVRIDPL